MFTKDGQIQEMALRFVYKDFFQHIKICLLNVTIVCYISVE